MDLLSRLLARKPATETVTLAADVNESREVMRLAEALQVAALDARVQASDTTAGHLALAMVAQCEQELKDYREQIATVTFELAGVGPTVVEELIAQHPPTEAQVQAAADTGQSRPRYDVDTFAPALLALTITRVAYSDDPDGAVDGLTLEETTALWASPMPVEDREALFYVALSLDRTGTIVGDLGKG